MSEKNWSGPYHCPDCPNPYGCTDNCNRVFNRNMQDFMRAQMKKENKIIR